MIQEMEDTLVDVRSAAARSIADKKDLNRKLESLDGDQQYWGDKAELAIHKGRDDLAKAALVEKSRVAAACDALKRDYIAVDEGLAKLNEDIARLEETTLKEIENKAIKSIMADLQRHSKNSISHLLTWSHW